MALPDESVIDAKLEELDRLIAELQKRRQELLEAKQSLRAATPLPKKEPSVAVASQPAMVMKAAPKSIRPSPADRKPDPALERALNSLPWKSFKKKEGEWTFLRDRDGNVMDDIQSAKEFLEEVRRGNDVVVGKYRYRVSEDKFLNRYFAG